MINKALEILQDKNITVHNLYMYGSRVYGTHSTTSDYDFICISTTNDRVEVNDITIHLYTLETFKSMVDDHEISVLECLSLSDNYKYETITIPYEIDLPTLRKSISSKVSNSFAKARKKITLSDEDTYIGLKSLFHSFRMIDYGCQLAVDGKIVDFSTMNYIWIEINEVFSLHNTWDDLHNVFKPIHNNMLTKFRTLAPK